MEIGDISPSIFDKGWVSGGALPQKLVTGERGHIDPLFSTRSHPLTPFFHSLSSNDSLFLIIHNQFWTISHRMTPFLGNISSNSIFSEIFVKYVSNSFFAWKIYQNLSYSHRLTPILLVFSLNDPLFRRKISHRKTPSFELLSKHPRHFQS